MPTIVVTGGSGMVGRTLQDAINSQFYTSEIDAEWIFPTRQEMDLLNAEAIDAYFAQTTCDMVIHLAALVGGLYQNINHNSEMYYNNVQINNNLMSAMMKYGITRGIFCLSSCIYPANPPMGYPMTEEVVSTGNPHASNSGYAYSKRHMYDAIKMHREVDGVDWICVSPVNLYGEYDNFDLDTGHAIACLINKFCKASTIGARGIVQGDGTPVRQCLYTVDFVRALLCFIPVLQTRANELQDMYNIGSEEHAINEIANCISNATGVDHYGFVGEELGCPRKTVDTTLFCSLFPDFKFTPLSEGIEKTVSYYRINTKKKN